jgi:RNA polymerase sigma factor (sigma-70 family)
VPATPLHNEKRLVLSIKEGDRKAFQEFYVHYTPQVQQYLRLFVPDPADVDELAQDIFLKIWVKCHLLANVESFQGYLFRMCKNHVLNYFRSLKIGRKLVELSTSGEEAQAEGTEDQILFKQYHKIAMDGINKLSQGRRRILLMTIERGLSLDEIAAEMEITRAGVKKQLYAAMALVRKYLKEHGELSVLLFAFLSLFEV